MISAASWDESTSDGMVGCGFVSHTIRLNDVVVGALAIERKSGAFENRFVEVWLGATTWQGRQLSKAKSRPLVTLPEASDERASPAIPILGRASAGKAKLASVDGTDAGRATAVGAKTASGAPMSCCTLEFGRAL
jgi:hypothetical protein